MIRPLRIGRQLTSSLLIAAAMVAMTACSRGGILGVSAAMASGNEPSVTEMASATYEGILDEPITLTEGLWEGPPFVESGASRPSVGLVDHFVLTGDLDGDENTEAAVLLWQTSGGSGNRIFLAIMGRRKGRVTNLGTTLIGDRVQIRSGVIDNRRIVLDLVRAGPTDAACCPTETARISWVLSDDGLSLASQEVTGTLSLADLEGPEWILVELGWEQPVPESSEISLRFVTDKVEGNTGCNSYFAGVAASIPGEFGFNGMGATRSACPEPAMELERSYLKALAGASSYRFLAGRLVLGCDTDNGPVRLVFTPGQVAEEIELEGQVE